MNMILKFFQKLCLDKRFWFRRKKLVFALVIIVLIIKNVILHPKPEVQNFCGSLDVVYTWVNGSDTDFIRLIKLFDNKFDPARFDDKNELKYSLRSLQKFAPWVKHVYIVTNGQIPHWLDLNYQRVTVVQHSELADASILPIFSSSAIETFIHRIPGLSKQFLYLNDDIFLNAPLYPEDLHTFADGVKIYNAWTVPDCSDDCPWVYIGDGSCDQHCNIQQCQFDGGDCNFEEVYTTTELINLNMKQNTYDVLKVLPNEKNSNFKYQLQFPKKSRRTSFNEIIKRRNLTNDIELRVLVEKFNKEQKLLSKPRYNEMASNKFPFESTKDVYTHSLIHTNMLLNNVYGFKSRNVLAHVGFLLDKDIIDDMLVKFSKAIKETTSHRFRDPNDLQFSFLYYNFLMSETQNLSLSDIFDELDTDKSSTWSDREIRTLLARLYPLPLDWAAVNHFENVVNNCSKELRSNLENGRPYTTLVYERYEDSNIPTVTKYLVTNCSPLSEILLSNFAKKPKYKFYINQKRGVYSNFIMLTSNITEVVDSLDKLRRNPKKFNCINDNLEPQYAEDNQMIKHLLEDFYLSFFPERSKFELPDNYRNRFMYLDDYRNWKNGKHITLFIGYFLSVILTLILIKYCCYQKGRFARKYISYRCCDI